MDQFLTTTLGVTDYDRLYLPGGPGALSDASWEYLRKDQRADAPPPRPRPRRPLRRGRRRRRPLRPLPPPSPDDVVRIASSLARRVHKRLDTWGLFDADGSPDDDVEQLRAHALQQSLPFAASAQSLAAVQPRRHHRRLAVVDGFSLHADTFVHASDRQGLERLCRYDARGPDVLHGFVNDVRGEPWHWTYRR